jgi:hypothetical protein
MPLIITMTPDLPGSGPLIECRCGCGGKFRQFDEWGRERQWLRGHYLKFLQRKLAEATRDQRGTE